MPHLDVKVMAGFAIAARMSLHLLQDQVEQLNQVFVNQVEVSFEFYKICSIIDDVLTHKGCQAGSCVLTMGIVVLSSNLPELWCFLPIFQLSLVEQFTLTTQGKVLSLYALGSYLHVRKRHAQS